MNPWRLVIDLSEAVTCLPSKPHDKEQLVQGFRYTAIIVLDVTWIIQNSRCSFQAERVPYRQLNSWKSCILILRTTYKELITSDLAGDNSDPLWLCCFKVGFDCLQIRSNQHFDVFLRHYRIKPTRTEDKQSIFILNCSLKDCSVGIYKVCFRSLEVK